MTATTANALVTALLAGDETVLPALADFLKEQGQDDLAVRLRKAANAGRARLKRLTEAADLLGEVCRAFPGLVDGEDEVHGADLVDFLSERLGR